jgi:hypothetical protein
VPAVVVPAAAAAAVFFAGAASIGVIRVNDMSELQAAYHRVVKDLSKAKVRECACMWAGVADTQGRGKGKQLVCSCWRGGAGRDCALKE